VYGPPSSFRELPDLLGGWPEGRDRPPLEQLLQASEALDLMKVGAHPLRPLQSLKSVPPELLRRLDALEINAREAVRKQRVAAMATELGLPVVGGSDAHFSRHLGRLLNLLPGWVHDLPTLRQAVKSGQAEVLSHAQVLRLSQGQGSEQFAISH